MENKQQPQVGVIHEVGDMGLGFQPINEQEQQKINDKNKKKNK